MVVYETINKINGKRYIGKDKHNDPRYIGSGHILAKAIKKYGKDNFFKTILETCTSEEELNEKEIHWIKITNAQKSKMYYNVGPGGAGGDNFTNHPDKDLIRKKIKDNRATHIDKPHSESTKLNQKKAAVGRYTLNWFKAKYGEVTGVIKYEERNKFLKNRTSNVVDKNREKLDELIRNTSYALKDIYEHFKVHSSIIYRKLDQWYGCKNLKECRLKLNVN